MVLRWGMTVEKGTGVLSHWATTDRYSRTFSSRSRVVSAGQSRLAHLAK
jgi:hypothetical protein